MVELLERSLAALARRRPLFHSEADFLLALGWELHTQEPGAHVRLGQRLLRDPPVALDVFVGVAGVRYGIELKYLKARLAADVEGEHFDLAPDALDAGRYDVLHAVARLERLVEAGAVDRGCAVALSNAVSLWSEASAFDLRDGGSVSGHLAWEADAPRGHEAPIDLRGRYELQWAPYARVADDDGGELRYLAIVVG
jgi:hypothetical protein